MKKLWAFSDYLKTAGLVNPEQFSSWAEEVILEAVEKGTVDGFLIGRLRYDAVIDLEACRADPFHLSALILIWLGENDPNREDFNLGHPKLLPEIEDEAQNISSIEINVAFVDDIYLVEDSEGSLVYDGKTYGFGAHDLWVAESGTTNHSADASP